MNEGQGLQKLKRMMLSLERQNEKHVEKAEELDKKGDENLSSHGHWARGYHDGVSSAYGRISDDLEEIIAMLERELEENKLTQEGSKETDYKKCVKELKSYK